MQELLTVYRIYKRSTAPKYKDPICCNSCMGLSMFWPILYFLCETSTWHLDSCPSPPPEDTWYGVILWVLRVLGQSLDQSARIFFIRFYSGCYTILTSPKKGETAVYGYNPALFLVLSVSCWCLAKLIFTWYDQHCSILLAKFNMSTVLKLQSS